MLEIFSIVLSLILLSKYIEERTNISFVLIIVVLSYIAHILFDLSILKDNFNEIIYLMLPIILIPDILGLSSNELKENEFSIFFLAVIAVIISIILAVGFSYLINYFPSMPLSYLLILFTPLMATDVVSVGAIFSKFSLPSKLKLFAEGESLFNDITAMVIFFFIAVPLSNGADMELVSLVTLTLKTITFSMIIGVIFGYMGYMGFKYSHDNFDELISTYLMAAISFLVADTLKLSGILAVVVAVMFFKYFFNKEGHYKKKNYAAALLNLQKQTSNSILSLRAYKKESQYLGFFANAVIFTSIATVINIELLWKYKFEILYIFSLTTIIRYIVIAFFIRYEKHPIRWTNILTLAGMKGGLALIMIVSLSDDFIYKEMFVTITLGVVMLSIFIYTLFLTLYLHLEKDELIIDKAQEYHINLKNAKEIFQKDLESDAYNEIIFEDLVEKEIIRASRYHQQFVIVAFKVDVKIVKKISQTMIRKSDYLGKIDRQTYAILLTHTSLENIIGFTQKLQKMIQHKDISIAQYVINDTKDVLYEKLLRGFEHKGSIGIEV